MSNDVIPAKVERDGWGRPKIIPLVNGKPDLTAKLVPYTRVSTLASKGDDTTGLSKWQQRVVALGIVRNRALYQKLAVIDTDDDPLRNRVSDLTKVVETALTFGGADQAADSGTNFHELTEAADSGQFISPGAIAAPELGRALSSYLTETRELKVEAAELFVVNDEAKAAGTLDRLYRLPNGAVVVGDIKTGRDEPNYPGKVSSQCATYANGKRYDVVTGERSVLHEDLDPTKGLLVHAPLGTGVVTLYELDLEWGWRKALLSVQIRDFPKPAKLTRWQPYLPEPDDRMVELGGVSDEPTLFDPEVKETQ